MNSSFLEEDSVTRKRYASGSYNANTGIYTEGNITSISIKACIQPMKQYEIDRAGLKKLQNGGYIKIYTKEVLKVMENNQTADLITFDNKDYEIISIEHWKGKDQEFYKYIGAFKNA
jgi:hypothetical protein